MMERKVTIEKKIYIIENGVGEEKKTKNNVNLEIVHARLGRISLSKMQHVELLVFATINTWNTIFIILFLLPKISDCLLYQVKVLLKRI